MIAARIAYDRETSNVSRQIEACSSVPDLSFGPGPGLCIQELRARGWTLKLIEKFLGDEDRRDSINHWANFSGKKVYLVLA
jgi:hypothetical protein